MKVSIIIPVYNVEKYIARCLDSVINQTYQNLEIIVVNDVTPDNSMAIVDEYAARDSRIRIVNNPRNMGLMMTRKSGYSVVRGDYLTFLDSDDYLPLNAIELLVTKAQSTNADIVSGNVKFIKKEGPEEILKNRLPYGNDAEGVYKAMLCQQFPHILCSKLFKASLFLQHEYVSYENMINAEDVCLFYQIVGNCKHIECVTESVYYYMENPSSATHNRFSLAQIRSIVRANKVRLQSCAPYPELVPLADRYVTNILVSLYNLGHKRMDITKILQEEEMEQYCSFSHILQTLTLRDLFVIAKSKIASYIR